MGLQGYMYTLFFLLLLDKHRLWLLVRTASPRRSYEYPQSMFWAEIWKISEFLSDNFQFLVENVQYSLIGLFS